jgi:hypothetical protein
MKNVIRAFIVVLAITGAAASTQISSASTSKTMVSATIAKTSALPIPTCAPDDPNACGMAGK